MYIFPQKKIIEFEIFADELDHLLFLNFNNDRPGKGPRPVLQGALPCADKKNYVYETVAHSDIIIPRDAASRATTGFRQLVLDLPASLSSWPKSRF
jgi:hypothetical protein